MSTAEALYSSQEEAMERSLFPLLALSLILHFLVLAGATLLPGFLGAVSGKELPFDVMTVQLLGALEPPAPAAPAAPVDPDLRGPDTIEMPQTELIVPQPTPLERMITPVTPADVIPLGEPPPNEPPPVVEKNPEPPPKVELPDKTPPPKPKPKPKAPNNEAVLNTRIEELRRKKAAEADDQQIQAAIVDIAKARGAGNGTSSGMEGGAAQGVRIDPIREAYYRRIREIIRENWVPPASASSLSPDLQCTYVIVIQPDGRVSGKSLRRPSGISEFDQSVDLAITRSRLPRLPDVFGGKSDNPSFIFSYNYLQTG
ncbi:MAG: TonB C-terminal domain-containing protein [Deltaproteobacteria bacterium]|jgi:outer membrane biosynthesis protein TonB|nr:TonB C-terminal domain-containing protein [Deltaproteobacteria bacterium]